MDSTHAIIPTAPTMLPDAPDFPLDPTMVEPDNVEEVTPTAILAVGVGPAFQVPSALSTLAQQFLNEHTGGFTVAHARTLRYIKIYYQAYTII
jgi:hypothetical protein